MRSIATLLISFSGIVLAADTMLLLNLWYPNATTVTVKGINPTATIMEKDCPSSSASSASTVPPDRGLSVREAPTITSPPTNTPISVGRETNVTNEEECVPFKVTQGPSTWEYHLDGSDKDSAVAANCSAGRGGFASGTADCTISTTENTTTDIQILKLNHTELAIYLETVTLVTASDASIQKVSATPTGSVPGATTSAATSTAKKGSDAGVVVVPNIAIYAILGVLGTFVAVML